MKNILAFSFAFLFTLASFAQSSTSNPQKFLASLREHCGKAYKGEIVSPNPPADFKDKELIMKVVSCKEKEVKISFFVGEDLSRTWVFTLEDGKVKLKHDHRHQDGTPDKVTMYGGTATNTGFADMQFFPSDQETVDMMSSIAGNVWWVTIKDNKYTYNLKRVDSTGFFSASFDLSNTVETDKMPW
ncbi:hypothetical protein [Myroides marinus]|uniref:hypothetical protein n=1 Tax=Myroides marinus TaxID=703342 RepID=UPI002575186F|nr:hypothetical protein [Myroides marinus]MDM1379486.1 hypothetical protein [Myroides marinus]MDM1386757.1 hypothetical protein [Myroides marinus]MDM1393970.1 hypothetical protein [Myroides marinus]